MMPRNDHIPGLRQPTSAEKARIGEYWGTEVQQFFRRPRGQITRWAGVFLIAMSAAGLTRQEVDVAGIVVTVLVAAACFAVSALDRRSSKEKDRLMEALASGDYLVAPAISTKIWLGKSGTYTPGQLTARLPDGQPLQGVYRLPNRCAKQLLDQDRQQVWILLIKVSGYPELLTIPV